MKASEQAFDPPLGRLPAPEGVVVALLELAPLLGEETFKEILPAYVGLGLSCLSDFLILEVIKGQETAAPAVEVVKKGMLQVGVSSGIHQVSGELGHALSPDIIGSFSLALQHMGCVFRGIAPGTLVIILILPLHKGGAYSTVGRGMLGDPPAPAGLQSRHSIRAGFPVNGIFGLQRKSVVADPPHLGDWIHDDAVQVGSTGRSDLGVSIPQDPTFIVDGQMGVGQGGEGVKQVGPVLLGQGIHLAV